jgi:hypothetical protein
MIHSDSIGTGRLRMAWNWIPLFLLAAAASAQPSSPKPVPRMQVVPQAGAEISFQREGKEIARYHFGTNLNRPFLFPIIGPSGRSLTRMGHPRDPESHSHHNSIWISHHSVNDVSFWGDGGKGRIVHRRIERFEDGESESFIETANAWITAEGKALLNERRRITARWLPGEEWLLILDLQLEAAGEAVTFGKTPFGLVGVRMAKTIGVNDGGGAIRNSEGGVNEKEVFWKPARWVDYSGPITARAAEGITLLDHPANLSHPPAFHVRNDGWMGASLTFAEPLKIEAGKSVTLCYGFYVHSGVPELKSLQRRWEEFSKEAPGAFPAKKSQ